MTALLLLTLLAAPAPFAPDAHTIVLYHCDEGDGALLRDAGPHHNDAELHGTAWAPGRFGGGLRFNGKDAYAWRSALQPADSLTQVTVEGWFQQEAAPGRQFLLARAGGIYLELVDGVAAAVSLYDGGSRQERAGGGHRHVLSQDLVAPLSGWHHLAATYDGERVSFFVDGILLHRELTAAGFRLGSPSAPWWLGTYQREGLWFDGVLDELRLSDVVRYDPEAKLALGHEAS